MQKDCEGKTFIVSTASRVLSAAERNFQSVNRSFLLFYTLSRNSDFISPANVSQYTQTISHCHS
jgi:hypothetical protein